MNLIRPARLIDSIADGSFGGLINGHGVEFKHLTTEQLQDLPPGEKVLTYCLLKTKNYSIALTELQQPSNRSGSGLDIVTVSLILMILSLKSLVTSKLHPQASSPHAGSFHKSQKNRIKWKEKLKPD